LIFQQTYAIVVKLGSKELEGSPCLTRREKPAEKKGVSFDWKLELSKNVSKWQGARVERQKLRVKP